MKILTMCRGGNVRSVTLAYLFKYKYNIDSLACGWERNSPETNEMLFEWADLIITVEPYILTEKIPNKYHYKAKVYDIGEDVWGLALHPELISKCDFCIANDLELLNVITHYEWPDTNMAVTKNQLGSLDRLKNKELLKFNGFTPGLTAEEIWDSLSKEARYAIKLLMYRDKVTDHFKEFLPKKDDNA